ncbi:PAS domain-containing protein [Sphingomonas endolithica]|uniref:PAS domain-containing protein n=1 Tax=Sphingomonas endolithica TaxID=2972485 RepID=UPI0021AFBC57|nr:PAS domain-containing protein [Sphingomonas sp. ZFBP2030]
MCALPPSASDAPRAEIVTASELVRHFGLWQERAARAPVYVMFRGRPRLVLTSIELMETLLAPHLPDRDVQGPDPAALLDLIRDMVVVADGDLRVVAASRTARAYFDASVAAGVPVETLVPLDARDILLKVLRHVVAAGVAQTIDLSSPRRTGGLLTLTIEPHRRGIALLVQDITAPNRPPNAAG